jgi:hypothetical protein
MLKGVGVMGHVVQPTIDEGVAMISSAEAAGADWCVVPDAFGWRDVWMMLTAAAAVTDVIRIGPGLTNPYTRHPFVTLAALATLAELTGDRALLGIGAGGSELKRHGGIDRSDAPQQVRDLIEGLRAATEGEPPLPMASSMPAVPILASARGPKMMNAIEASCDMFLAFGQPHAHLEATADRIRPLPTGLGWAPIRRGYGKEGIAAITYALLNVREPIRRDLGLSEEGERRLREVLLTEGFDAAVEHVPDSALDAFLSDDDVEAVAAVARRLGVECITVLAFDTGPLDEQVTWAREVLDLVH